MNLIKTTKSILLFLLIAVLILPACQTNAKTSYIVSRTDKKYSYADMKKDLKQLEKKYPDLVKLSVLGKTADKRNIYCVRFSAVDEEEEKSSSLVLAGMHAREYINCQVAMSIIENYCRKYKKDNGLLRKGHAIYFVPMVNPDGVTISQYGIKRIRNKKLRKRLKKWTKNSKASSWKANARGVDLNRNFPAGWSNFKTRGEELSHHAGSDRYPGKKAASEAETKAIMQLTEEIKPTSAISLHSMGQLIYYGNKKSVKKKEQKLLKLVKKATGYRPVYESVSRAYGTAEDYFMSRKIPEVCIENGYGGTPVKHSQFSGILKKMQNIPWKAARLFT